MGTWSSSIGKFKKKDPSHGRLWKKIRNWWCGVGLCNMNTCSNKEYHQSQISGYAAGTDAEKEAFIKPLR